MEGSKNLVTKYFTRDELISIMVSILLVSLVFSFPDFSEMLLVTLITVSLYFAIKQPFHKLMAKRLQCTSTYKLWSMGIFATIFTIFLKITNLNFSILLPGYIEILPYRFGRKGIKLISMTPRDAAMISLSGLGAAMFFAIALTVAPFEFTRSMAHIIAWLLLYDMLPVPTSDGGRIFTWHIFGWVALTLISAIILIV
jgi:Zn-dependent protease